MPEENCKTKLTKKEPTHSLDNKTKEKTEKQGQGPILALRSSSARSAKTHLISRSVFCVSLLSFSPPEPLLPTIPFAAVPNAGSPSPLSPGTAVASAASEGFLFLFPPRFFFFDFLLPPPPPPAAAPPVSAGCGGAEVAAAAAVASSAASAASAASCVSRCSRSS